MILLRGNASCTPEGFHDGSRTAHTCDVNSHSCVVQRSSWSYPGPIQHASAANYLHKRIEQLSHT